MNQPTIQIQPELQVNTQLPQENNLNKILIAVVGILAVVTAFVGGYYFWKTKQIKQQTVVVPTQLPTPLRPSDSVGQAPSIQPDQFAGWKTYENKNVGISFQYPADFPYVTDSQTWQDDKDQNMAFLQRKYFSVSLSAYTEKEADKIVEECWRKAKEQKQIEAYCSAGKTIELIFYDVQNIRGQRPENVVGEYRPNIIRTQDGREWIYNQELTGGAGYAEKSAYSYNHQGVINLIIGAHNYTPLPYSQQISPQPNVTKTNDADYLDEEKTLEDFDTLTMKILRTVRIENNNYANELKQWKRYEDNNNKFAFSYPADWNMDKNLIGKLKVGKEENGRWFGITIDLLKKDPKFFHEKYYDEVNFYDLSSFVRERERITKDSRGYLQDFYRIGAKDAYQVTYEDSQDQYRYLYDRRYIDLNSSKILEIQPVNIRPSYAFDHKSADFDTTDLDKYFRIIMSFEFMN